MNQRKRHDVTFFENFNKLKDGHNTTLSTILERFIQLLPFMTLPWQYPYMRHYPTFPYVDSLKHKHTRK
jgi:hypothetical protein